MDNPEPPDPPSDRLQAARQRAAEMLRRHEAWERDIRRLYEYLAERLLQARTARERSADELSARLAALQTLPDDEAAIAALEKELLAKEREQAARQASEIDRLRSRFKQASDEVDPELKRLRNDIEVAMRRLSKSKDDMKALLSEADFRRLCAEFEARKDELHRRRAAAERKRGELELGEARWPARLKRAADQGYRRLASARRRRERTAERYRLKLEALRKECARAKEQVEAMRAKSAGEDVPAPDLEQLGRLEAARLSWVFGRQAHWEARSELNARLAAVDAELRDAALEIETLEREAARREEDAEKERLRIVSDFKKQCRELRARFPLAPLHKQVRALERQLARQRAAAGQFEPEESADEAAAKGREAAKDALERRLRSEEEAWTKEKADLDAAMLLKRRELKKKRARLLELQEEAQRRVSEMEEARKRSAQDISSRLSRLRARFASRCADLERMSGTLRAQTAKAKEDQKRAAARFREERAAFDARLSELRARCGELHGKLAASQEEAGRIQTALRASLNEIEGKMVEAEFETERLTAQERALSKEHAEQLSQLEAARSRFEQLADEFLVRCGASAPLWEQWKTLGSHSIGRLSEIYRQEILSRAADIAAWRTKLGNLEERLSASESAFRSSLAAACREAGLKAFLEGDISGARARMKRCLSLGPDAEAERILGIIGAEDRPPSPADAELPEESAEEPS